MYVGKRENDAVSCLNNFNLFCLEESSPSEVSKPFFTSPSTSLSEAGSRSRKQEASTVAMNPPFFNGQPAGPPGHPLPGGHHPGGPMVSPPGGEGFAPAPVPPPFLPPNWLPPGWTEHKAPDGMAYYYNASMGTSSWIRPTLAPPPLPPGMPGFAPLGPPPPGVFQQSPPGLPGYPANQQPLHPPGVAPPALAATSSSKEEPGKGKKPKKVKKEKAVKKYATPVECNGKSSDQANT